MTVTKETAILAKEKGFKNRVASYYDEAGQFFKCNKNPECDLWDYNTSFEGWCSAPTQSELWQWLIDEHKLFVLVSPLMSENLSDLMYEVDVIDLSDYMSYVNVLLAKVSSDYEQVGYKTNIEAFEVGLRKALEKV